MSLKYDLKDDDNELIKSTNRSLDLLRYGKFEEALNSFNLILKLNYSSSIAESGIKYCKYWMPRINKIIQINDNYEKGKTLFKEWKKFETFANSIKNVQKKAITNIMFFILNTALDAFKKDLRENRISDFETIFIIALSYKKIGDFKNSIKYFEESLNLQNDNSNIIAQLADCYALIDQEKKAKLLFREAFFLDPSSIELDLLDSNIITYIITKILESNISKKEMNYWIPIYGRILGIFNIYRELVPYEIMKIKKEILYLENNYKNQIESDNCLKTKLLNCYFWLYDNTKNRNNELISIEKKIKDISEEVYNIFKNDNKKIEER